MRKSLRIIDKTSEITLKIMSLLIIPLTLVVVYTVIMRFFFSNSPDWGFEIPIFLYGTYFMVAGAGGLRSKVHVSVDIFPSMLSEKGQKILRIISSSIIIIIFFLLVWKGTQTAIESTIIKEHSTHQSSFNPQIWWFKWVIPISSFLILLQALKELIEEFIQVPERIEKRDDID